MSTRFKNGSSDDIIGPASTLASGVSVGATSMTVATGTGDRFPVVASPDIAYVTLQNATKVEIVKITARAAGADTMTIVKAQEGTTDRAWLTGDIVSMRITAAQAESAVNAQEVAAAALAVHEAAADPHPGYTTTAELAAGLATKQAADAQLDTLSGLSAQQATDLVSLSAFVGGLLNDADAPTALATLGALLNGTLTKTAGYTFVKADRGKLVDFTGAGGYTLAFDAAATLGVWAGAVRNSTSGTITLDPNLVETIDSATTVSLSPGESCFVICDGTELKTVGRTVSQVTAGQVGWFAMNTAPTGWLKANGAAVSRSSYAALFAAIGTTFGAGDGSTTFNLPDLRGEFIRGWDDGRGVDSGRAFGSAQSHQMQSHTHIVAAGANDSGASVQYANFGTNYPQTTSAAGGTSNGSENRPRNIALLACIKY